MRAQLLVCERSETRLSDLPSLWLAEAELLCCVVWIEAAEMEKNGERHDLTAEDRVKLLFLQRHTKVKYVKNVK